MIGRIIERLESVPESSVKGTAETTRGGDVLGYARLATADQDVAAQEERLRQAGAIRVFVDVISGRQFERPGLTQLIDHARAGDSLCVTRLGRSLKELLETVENLKAHDIHLVSLEERIDTTAAAGEPVFRVSGAIAHFERRLIYQRTRDGIAAARKRGRRPSRPPLDRETVSATQTLVEPGLTAGQAANLKAHDIHLVSLEERIDTTAAAGEPVFRVSGAIAHFERRLIYQRTRDGIAAARKRGRRPSRPPLDRETVSATQTLVEPGLTAGQAAKQLGIGRATAYRIAKAAR